MQFLRYFENICAIPHCSLKSEKLGEFLFDFAQKRGFETKIDKAGNIHAIKGKPKICLQAHYDMVCVGDAPQIKIINDGKTLRAQNSSLGADNGIGVAIIMQMMDEKNDLEVLFTNNEEVGLLGASAFKGKIKAPNLLNLDSERDDEVIIGCAGGAVIELNKKIGLKACKNGFIYELVCEGLPSGHSGTEIAKNIPNAITELFDYINKYNPKIIKIQGGNRINAIPANAKALVLSKKKLKNKNLVMANELVKVENGKLCSNHQGLKEFIEKDGILCYKNSNKIAQLIFSLPHGVLAWQEEVQMPKTSNNKAIIKQNEIKTNKKAVTLGIELYTRSNDEKELSRLCKQIKAQANLANFKVKLNEYTLPWEPKESDFAHFVLNILQKRRPNAALKAIHAGLECGIIQAKNKDLQTCSIGPNILSPHTTHESCEIDSAKMIFEVVNEILG